MNARNNSHPRASHGQARQEVGDGESLEGDDGLWQRINRLLLVLSVLVGADYDYEDEWTELVLTVKVMVVANMKYEYQHL